MKKAKKLFVIAFIILFSSCANTPTELLDINKKIDNNKAEVINIEYDSLKTIVQKIPEDLMTLTDNFVLPQKVNITGECLSSYSTIPYCRNLQSLFPEIIESFYGNDSFNKANYRDLGSEYSYLDYIDTANNYRAVVSKNNSKCGMLVLSKNERYGIEISNTEYPVEDVIHIDRGDNTNKLIKLSGSKYSINEAIDFSENWINTFWKKYESEYTYNVKTVIIRKAPKIFDESGGSDTLELIIERKLNLIPIDELGQFISDDRISLYNSFITVKMIKPEDIFFFALCGSYISSIDVEHPVDIPKILTLKSAIELASNYVSGYKKLEISQINLKYAISQEEVFPVWSFEIDNNEHSINRRSIYVNAANGEIYDQMEIIAG